MNQQDPALLEAAQQLVWALQAQQTEQIAPLIDRLNQLQEGSIYTQLSTLAQNLHQTLDELPDNTLLLQTKNDLPDATERLQSVIQILDEASHTTLTRLENSMALLSQLQSSPEIAAAHSSVLQDLRKELEAILSAQAYQDLTGQVLNRVIYVLSALEQSLMALIISAGHDYAAIPSRQLTPEQLKQGVGPNVTQASRQDALDNQADVDDLLSELGI
ncbi:MAG: protein phosphatase CheZ [Thiotrichales bacterium]|nr:protein phosphatase CheZ [Thiotrichales bacterium]